MKRYSMTIDISESASLAKKVKIKEVIDENGQWIKYKECKWKYNETTDDYDTDCERSFMSIIVAWRSFTYCPYCGGEIKVEEG